MPRITNKAWFGPKRLIGWGWTFKSWEGAVASAVFVALLALALTILGGPARYVVGAVILAAFAVLVFLTGDPPGGPGLRM